MKKIAFLESDPTINIFKENNYFQLLKVIDLDEYKIDYYTDKNLALLFLNDNFKLLSYDALIINANDDTFIELLNAYNDPITRFIEYGKGIILTTNNLKTENTFLPEFYQYQVFDINEVEQKKSITMKQDYDVPKFILSYPNTIDNNYFNTELKSVILPNIKSYYIDISNLKQQLFVSTPVKNQKVILTLIPTDELIKEESLLTNLLFYASRGIPRIAFVMGESPDNNIQKIRTEVELFNHTSIDYKTIDEVETSRNDEYHNIYIFSKKHSEASAISFFNKYRNKKILRVFYYDCKSKDCKLEELTNYDSLEYIKNELYSLTLSNYSDGFFLNSFYLTLNVLECFSMLNLEYDQFLDSIMAQINLKYQEGSYDNDLDKTLYLYKVLNMIQSNSADIKKKKVEMTAWIEKQFPIQSEIEQIKTIVIGSTNNLTFLETLDKDIQDKIVTHVDQKRTMDFTDKPYLIDRLEYIVLFMAIMQLYHIENKDILNQIEKEITFITKEQDEFGIWNEDLIQTARIVNLLYSLDMNLFSSSIQRKVEDTIFLSVIHLKKANLMEQKKGDLVFLVLVSEALYHHYGERLEGSIDLIHDETKRIIESKTIDFLTKSLEQLIETNIKDKKKIEYLNKLEKNYYKNRVRLNTVSTLISVLAFLLVSYYVYLALENIDTFKNIMTQSLMWVPIAIGLIITPSVNFISKKIIGKQMKDRNKDLE